MALSKKPIPLVDLHLPPALERKLSEFADTARLRVLRPSVLITEWKITPAQWDRLNKALASRGQESLGEYVAPEKPEPRAASLKGKCRKPVIVNAVLLGGGVADEVPCGRKLLEGKRSCLWHWLADQPIEVQVEWADQRRRIAEDEWHNTRVLMAESPAPFVERKRVPESEWPDGERWCSDCQMMIPLFYCSGSKCKAHASRAAHASMVERVYQLSREDYDRLLAWQGGRCYICQQVPRVRRLAVDHDHATGEVRGLLCANDEWGCNHTLARVLNSAGMAQRLLDYVTETPIQRMRRGEDPVVVAKAPPSAAGARVREQARSAATAPPRRENDPFKGFL